MPREWVLVPLFVIEDAAERTKDGRITDYVYDLKAAQLTKSAPAEARTEVTR